MEEIDYYDFKRVYLHEQYIKGNRTYYKGVRNIDHFREPHSLDMYMERIELRDGLLWVTQRFGYALRYIFREDIKDQERLLEPISMFQRKIYVPKEVIKLDKFRVGDLYGWVYPIAISGSNILDLGYFRDMDIFGQILKDNIPYFKHFHPHEAGAELSELIGGRDWYKELDLNRKNKTGLTRKMLIELIRTNTHVEGIANTEYGVASIGLFQERLPQIKVGNPIKIYLERDEEDYTIIAR